jgi:hypothetical protein
MIITPPKDVYQKFKPTPEQIELAHKRAEKFKGLESSFTRGEKSAVGCLGEIIIYTHFPYKYVAETEFGPNYNADVEKGGLLWDVKTATCKSPPIKSYEGSVTEKMKGDRVINQGCYGYIFCRALEDFSILWVLGKIRRDLFFQKAYFVKEGQQYGGIKKVRRDFYSIYFSDLLPMDTPVEDEKSPAPTKGILPF